jgi:hypothetical protein
VVGGISIIVARCCYAHSWKLDLFADNERYCAYSTFKAWLPYRRQLKLGLVRATVFTHVNVLKMCIVPTLVWRARLPNLYIGSSLKDDLNRGKATTCRQSQFTPSTTSPSSALHRPR